MKNYNGEKLQNCTKFITYIRDETTETSRPYMTESGARTFLKQFKKK
jgi:hypothetical protein